MSISKFDLIQLINENNKNRIQETIEDVNDLISEIDKNPKQFIYELAEEIEEWSLERSSCPLCGSHIIKLDSSYENSEYFGHPTQEIINTYGCENSSCPYIRD